MATVEELQAKVSDLEEKVGELSHEAKGHRLRAKSLEQQLKSFKDAGLDPEKDISEQLEALKESASAGKKDASEFSALQKQMDTLMKKLADSETKAERSAAEAKLEKARSAFSAKSKEHFTDADTVIDLAIAKGLVTLDENGNPGLKDGDEFIPLNAEKGPGAVDKLKTMFPKLAITTQKAGGKDTTAKGASGTAGNAKQMRESEFKALSIKAQGDFALSGGEVTPD